MTTKERLMKAIAPLGKTEAERAKRIGFTVRTLDNWAAGKGLRTLARLEAAGIIRIVEPIEPPDQIAA